MANTQFYTGTPEQIAKQIGILPRTTKYRATLIPEETEPKKHSQEEIALANQRLRSHIVEVGNAGGLNNDQIDADLVRVYADTHEEPK